MTVPVGLHQEVAAGLARRVRIARRERCALIRQPGRHVAVHLVGADLQEPLHAGLARRLEQHVQPYDVGADKSIRVEQRAVHVRLGRKVDYRIHLFRQCPDRLAIRDVGLDETEARVVVGVGQVGAIAGVGQLVQADDAVLGVLL